MTEKTTKDTKTGTRSSTEKRKGAFIIILLALVFFTLLALLFLYWPRDRAEVPTEEVLVVVPQELKIRTEPSAQGAVLATVYQGDELNLLQRRGAWAQVRTAEGLTGWAERSALETPAERSARLSKMQRIQQLPFLEGVVTADSPLYAGAGLFYPTIGQLTKGDRIRVYTREQDFYAIAVGNDIAWVEVDGVDLAAGAVPELQVAARDRDSVLEEEEDFQKPFEDFAREMDRMMEERERRETAERAARAPEPAPAVQPLADGVYANVPSGGTAPRLVRRVQPEYPPAARRAGVQGRVLIRAIVRKDGSVDRAEILQDRAFGLGDAARQAVQRWQFEPATYNGQPIDVYYTVSFDFQL
jgi:TonB family protein